MDLLPLALVLSSAMLHASWNLLIKSSADRLVTAWAQVVAGGVAFLPFLVVLGVPWEALASIVASGIVHLAYGLLLVAAYDHADLSLVYPIARGTAPVIVTAVAWFALDDRVSAVGAVAIGLVVVGVLSVAAGSSRRGLGLALATGVAIAGYTLIDGAAVRTLDGAIAYTFAVFVSNSVFYTAYVVTRRPPAVIAVIVRANWPAMLFGGLASAGAYALVLAAARLAPLGLVSAFRETSVLFGVLGGWLLLGERSSRARITGAVSIAAGLGVLVVFGG